MLFKLIEKMVEYEAGVPHRVHHFLKVHSFAKIIGTAEKIDSNTLFTLEVTAIVHDIGIKPSLEKYNSSNGKYQELEGPKFAEEMLNELGLSRELIDRVCYLVGHHHTYKNVDGIDYQILLEADFLVNMLEENMSENAIESAYKNIFKTSEGKRLCRLIYSVENDK